MKLVVDNTPKKKLNVESGRRRHEKLMTKLENTRGTHIDLEQIVIQNLKDTGL